MLTRSKIYKLCTVMCLMFVLCIVLMLIFDDGQSFYYYPREQKRLSQQRLTTKRLNLDKTKEPSEQEMINLIEHELFNVPFDYWIRNENKSLQKNETCAVYPSLLEIEYFNKYWQMFDNANVRFKLYGAYYDKRPSVDHGHVVRLLAMVNQSSIDFPLSYCQLWFEHSTEPIIVPLTEYKLIWVKSWRSLTGYQYPQLLTCHLPDAHKNAIPQAVSLVASECANATNSLRVIFEEPKRNEAQERFAVCVKGLNFPYTDMSVRLVEWLELMRILGAAKIFTYDLGVHPNVSKVLRYYEEQDYVDVRPLTLGSGDPDLVHYQQFLLKTHIQKKRFNELIPLNDCFYRNMYKYKYIATVDIDEVMMPLGNLTSWHQIMDIIEQTPNNRSKDKCPNGFASICFVNTFFPSNTDSTVHAEDHLYMVRHIQRYANYSEPNLSTKCFQNTSEALTIHNHFSLSWLKSCGPVPLHTQMAQLQHYREPPEGEVNLGKLVTDRSIWRFKAKLSQRTTKVLSDLGFLI